jgi:hypothetical protein
MFDSFGSFFWSIMALTGAVTWVLGILIVTFYWLCSRPHNDEGEKNV